MKRFILHLRLSTFLGVSLALSLAGAAFPARGAGAEKGAEANADGDQAWAEVVKAAQPPPQPAEWNTKEPTPEEIEQYKKTREAWVLSNLPKVKDFYTRFPTHASAVEAKGLHHALLASAVQAGRTNLIADLNGVEKQLLASPEIKAEDRFEIRKTTVESMAMSRHDQGMPAVLEVLEQGVRQLQKEFPTRPEVYQMLLTIASNSDAEKGKSIAQEIAQSKADSEVREMAKGMLKKMEMVGKPVAIKFKAVDGQEVDLAKLKGKVVLVDFWATWCGPCVAELPNVKATYEKLHPKGLEIVGISFDSDKAKLQKFVAKEQMPWVQYFDGLGWENKIGTQYGIASIPTMWLVDKKGNLRDLNARSGLEEKAAKLLAEGAGK